MMWAVLHFQQSVPRERISRSFCEVFGGAPGGIRFADIDAPLDTGAIYLDVREDMPPAFPFDVVVSIPQSRVPQSDRKIEEVLSRLSHLLGVAILADVLDDSQYRLAHPSGVVLPVTIDERRFEDASELVLSEESRADLARAVAAAA